ncbi:antitermination protein [Erwinia endophytica]|uniref:antitermination protein Q n=1 Tax=Erwinia endophytica TaxID=1563158 RepID=UPI00126604B6|nr:antitermination protein [Erwinia endophytica]KAB8312276.1 antitermination protein [Erwinia endophytica]
MKLESAVKYFNPKSPCVDAAVPTTGDSLSGTDLMAAIGFCQSKSRFGLAAFLAKAGISDDDRKRAIGYLLSYAHRTAPKLVVKAAGGKLHKCLAVLSTLAFEEYSRSAATVSECQHCYGVGFVSVWRDVVKYPGYINKQTGEMVIEPRTEHRCVREKCAHCGGKGQIVARCRCNGTGRVRDVEKSALQGVPVDRECERCNGRGFRRMPGTKAYRAIHTLLPELQERTWNNNWRPFFDRLVEKCRDEETRADIAFRKASGG